MSDSPSPTEFGQFFAEMRRRQVVRFAFGYAAAAFVVLQLAEIVFPAFGLGEGALRLLVVATGLGFPPALVLAWMYDLTQEGIRRTDGATAGPLLPRIALGALLIATLSVAGGLGLYLERQGVFESPVTQLDDVLPTIQLAAYDPEAPIHSIAVLPLEDYSEAQNQAYFTSSMQEELIANLSNLVDMRVVSRTSARQFAGSTATMPEIGRILDADMVIEGSVSRTAARTRVTLQLIHAPSDTHIETLQWDRQDVEDVLAFQTEIARDVVRQVSRQQDEAPPVRTAGTMVQPEAQDAYLRGRYEFDRGTADGLRRASEYFASALSIDPDFAPAMAGVAGARFLIELEQDTLSTQNIVEARDVALEALQLDSSSMEVREVVSLIEQALPSLIGVGAIPPEPKAPPTLSRTFSMNGGRDTFIVDQPVRDSAWISVRTSLGERIASRMRHRESVGGSSASDQALREARRHALTGQFGDAIEKLEHLVSDDPAQSEAWELLSRLHVSTGELRSGVETLDDWRTAGAAGAPSRDDLSELIAFIRQEGSSGYWRWQLARLEARMARNEHVPLVEVATAHAGIGDGDKAVEYLIAAIRDGEPGLFTVRSNPVWDSLRTDPRLREISRQSRSLRPIYGRGPTGA